MRMIFLLLSLFVGLIVAGVAAINTEVVTLNYYFGQATITLFMLILGSAAAGAIFMGFLGIYRSIHNYMSSQGERGHKKDLQHRVKVLEDEKKKMEDELKKQQKEREDNAVKAQAALEDEKRRLENELRKQQKEHQNETEKAQTY